MDFADFITDLAHGRVHQQLGEAMQRIVSAVEDTGAEGSLTIKLKVTMDGVCAKVDVDAKEKIPREKMPGSMFFFGQNGSLHREDPRQLKLKAIDDPQPNMRVVKGEDE
ncbi:MAG TPA: hypothetical protein VFG83_16620 [Kofleriaceae bacterium]|nr:hypothetical protein [Kofleriaceae bacterium]